jgi:hypothetical protein
MTALRRGEPVARARPKAEGVYLGVESAVVVVVGVKTSGTSSRRIRSEGGQLVILCARLIKWKVLPISLMSALLFSASSVAVMGPLCATAMSTSLRSTAMMMTIGS